MGRRRIDEDERKKPFTISLPYWMIKKIKQDKNYSSKVYEILKDYYKR